jgi:myo-inositol 2-dehydrogenase / D-chiro-inositol 1-dehydrogenase
VQDFFIARYAEAYRAEIDHFVQCVEAGRTPMASFADGRAALALADAALESARTGRTVRL